MQHIIEAKYPLSFRAEDARQLGSHIRHHNSVSLIGMKRVGISNFLRFFLNHPGVEAEYIQDKNHLLIMIDLNNLVERTLFAFWMLLLKKIVDTCEQSDLGESAKETARDIFTQSIQLGDFFFTVEAVHKVTHLLAAGGKFITFFFVRFDRLQDVITPEFYANLQGLKDLDQHLTYVFTSFRPLYEMSPTVFTRASLAGFLHEMYIKPADTQDMRTILSTFQQRYDVQLTSKTTEKILTLAAGHVQYLLLCLIALKNDPALAKAENLEQLLSQDEEIHFLSEELWSSLTTNEQEVLRSLSKEQCSQQKYLTETGLIIKNSHCRVFNPLLQIYLDAIFKQNKKSEFDFTRKEHLLFTLLKTNEGKLVERETIIETVWPDEVELGVSDWSIDRLVSRVRAKLSAQDSEYKISTVITRGYKLLKNGLS